MNKWIGDDLNQAEKEAAVAAAYERAEVLCQIEIDRGDKNSVPIYASGARACREAIRARGNTDALAARIRELEAERDQLRQQYEHDRGTVRAAVNAAEAAEAKLAVAVETLEGAQALHQRYCDRVGAADDWARNLKSQIDSALAQTQHKEDG